MKFKALLRSNGKTATGIRIPAEIIDRLGPGKRPPVRVTINGYTYRSTVAVMGGQFLLGVSAEVRERAGVAAGDELTVDLVLDTEPRTITVPPDLKKALASNPGVRDRFEALSYSGKQRLVLPIEQAKTAETRLRRIEKAVDSLRAR